MTIRVNLQKWPTGARNQVKHLAALTIEPNGENSYIVTARDHLGTDRSVTINDWCWEATHPWRLIAEALKRLEEAA